MIEMKFSKNDEEDGLFRISSRDIVGFYNCRGAKWHRFGTVKYLIWHESNMKIRVDIRWTVWKTLEF